MAPVLLGWRSMKLGRLALGLAFVCVLGIAACEGSEEDDNGGGDAGQAGHNAAGARGSEFGGAAGAGAGGADAGQAGLSSEAGGGAHAGQGGAWGGEGGGNVGGDGPAPAVTGTDCNGDALTLDADLVRQCVLLTSCAPFGSTSDCIADGIDSTSFHLSSSRLTPFRFDARITQCIGSLDGCEDVAACTGERHVIDECETTTTSHCAGNFAVNCGGAGRVLDCLKLTGEAGACRVFGEGAQAHAECVVTDDCEEANETHCAGERLYRCDEPGPGYGLDCAAFGLECVEQGDGFAECVLPREPEPCDNPGTSSCDGAIIRVCGDDGVSYERDCSVLGDLVCGEGEGDQPQDTPWFDCVPKGCSTRFEVSDRCDDGELVLDLGQDNPGVRISCTDYGLATCSDHHCVP